jgi:hypothetical protein
MLLSILSLVLMQGAAILGTYWGTRLPAQHLEGNGRDAAKLAAGLVTTLAALVMGLLVKSSSTTFHSANTGFAEMSAKIILLDGALAHFGRDSSILRQELRMTVTTLHQQLWPNIARITLDNTAPLDDTAANRLQDIHEETRWDTFPTQIRALPADTAQLQLLRDEALQLSSELIQLRMVLLQSAYTGLPSAVLAILLVWCILLFAMLGILTPNNPTVKAMIFASAFSVAGGFFLILEMSHPLDGFILIPDTPFERALAVIGK